MSKSENLQSASSTVKPLWQVQTSPEHQRENKWRPWSENNRTHSAWMWCMWMSLCEACERVVTLSLCHEQSAISYISDTYSVTYSWRGECPTFLSLCVQCFDCNVNASDFKLKFQVLSSQWCLERSLGMTEHAKYLIYEERQNINTLPVCVFTSSRGHMCGIAPVVELHLLNPLLWYYPQLIQHLSGDDTQQSFILTLLVPAGLLSCRGLICPQTDTGTCPLFHFHVWIYRTQMYKHTALIHLLCAHRLPCILLQIPVYEMWCNVLVGLIKCSLVFYMSRCNF